MLLFCFVQYNLPIFRNALVFETEAFLKLESTKHTNIDLRKLKGKKKSFFEN